MIRLRSLALLLLPAFGLVGPATAQSAASADLAAVTPADSLLAAAADAVARGLPYRASRLLDPVLRDPARRTPETVLLAATAASRWGGWPEVARILAGTEWPDASLRGPAMLLSARAAVELGADTAAVADAREALADLGDPQRRAEALIVLGQAQGRLGQADSGAAAYLLAAELVPVVGDWLRLRAASLTADSLRRASLYAAMRLSPAQARVPAAEAAARERSGDLIGAGMLYLQQLGNPATALRLRLQASADTVARAELRHELVAFLGTPAGGGEIRAAIAVLDSAFGRLTPEEDLAVARAAGPAGLPTRAADGFSRAFDAGVGTIRDRFDFANALFRLGRYDDAATAYARIPAKDSLGGVAAYQRGRALLRGGQTDRAKTVFSAVAKRFPRDSAAAAPALWLLADLATDDRHDDQARKLFLQVSRRFPASRFTPISRLEAGLIALLGGHAKQAAREFDQLAASPYAGDEGLAATYWAGRAWAESGDSARARERWQSIVGGTPTSYYAGLSERRLGVATWRPPEAPDSFAGLQAADSAIARAGLLARLGLQDEARREYDQAAREGDVTTEGLLYVADELRGAGLVPQAIRLARRAGARGAPADARLYRLLYPVVKADALLAEATAQGLEPGFVAALIRQESLFDPGATSGAGARGLMQVMPDLGGSVARSLKYPDWDAVLLWQADVNLAIGTRHLSELVAQYREPVRVLAAYNAGASRVDRWAEKAGMDDPEIFAERIPFVETRDYVRVIQRNRDLYRVLYGW